MRYAYYPGCTAHTTSKEYEMSVHAVCEELDIELIEIEDWNCCGALEATGLLLYALNARTLALSEKGERTKGLDVVAACNACYINLARTNVELKENEELRKKISEIDASLDYKGTLNVRHILDVIANDVGEEKIKSKVKKNLGIKVAPYYGCFIGRPSNAAFDDPDDPTAMDRVLEAAGAEVVDFRRKAKCCGGGLMMFNPEISYAMTRMILDEAKRADVDCISVACPLCQMMLDAKQQDIEEKYNEEYRIPVLYFTQLLGLALGISEGKLGLGKVIVSPKRVLDKVK
ncbi:MAG: CoB--CoM heterodisulfide reductase iron-sulfur subunit B family protein [Candidatus Methanospirare jalkutatii]|nr:CoB--CoM heterodisulfide reductase iron-sulfur subunit B family protein [Candidatus Methanospirare jalkutatii]MCW7078338.1 CoB--CoM heterodisulfide reductase iron-sulfur subunit B family protein [Candidatus Methanoxibalbensis ujae]